MRLADGQLGVVAHRQLLEAGLSPKIIARRRESGLLRPVHRGVYAVGHLTLTEPARRLAAVLACGPAALLSHRSAAVAWGMLSPGAEEWTDVTVVKRNCRRRQGIVLHKVATLAGVDRTHRDGVPITSPARTLLDLAATARPRELEKALDEGRHRGVLAPRAISEVLERYPHRPGCALLADLVDSRAGGTSARTRSGIEDRLLGLVRRAGLPPPEVNARIGAWTPDFLWRAQKLVVEVDSYLYHSSKANFERDRRKDLALRALGYEVLRFTADQLDDQPELVLAHIAAALARRAAAFTG